MGTRDTALAEANQEIAAFDYSIEFKRYTNDYKGYAQRPFVLWAGNLRIGRFGSIDAAKARALADNMAVAS